MNFQDITLIAALFNVFSMLGNLVWSFKLNSFKGHGEMIQYWKEECEKKDNQLNELDERLQNMVKRKNEMKMQYHNQVAINKRLEGRLQTYTSLHDKLRFDYKEK